MAFLLLCPLQIGVSLAALSKARRRVYEFGGDPGLAGGGPAFPLPRSTRPPTDNPHFFLFRRALCFDTCAEVQVLAGAWVYGTEKRSGEGGIDYGRAGAVSCRFCLRPRSRAVSRAPPINALPRDTKHRHTTARTPRTHTHAHTNAKTYTHIHTNTPCASTQTQTRVISLCGPAVRSRNPNPVVRLVFVCLSVAWTKRRCSWRERDRHCGFAESSVFSAPEARQWWRTTRLPRLRENWSNVRERRSGVSLAPARGTLRGGGAGEATTDWR